MYFVVDTGGLRIALATSLDDTAVRELSSAGYEPRGSRTTLA